MARKLRVQFAGAIYHVMNRGDRREAIFADDEDRRLFMTALDEVCEKTDWQIHAVSAGAPEKTHFTRCNRIETAVTAKIARPHRIQNALTPQFIRIYRVLAISKCKITRVYRYLTGGHPKKISVLPSL